MPPHRMGTNSYRVRNKLRSPAGNRALLDDDCALARVLGHEAGDGLESRHVGGTASTDTALLGGGVDGDEDHVSLGDVSSDVGREEEVALAAGHGDLAILGRRLAREAGITAAVAGDTHNVVHARLVNGRVAGVPAADAHRVAVDDGDLDVWVLVGDDSGSRTTWVRDKTSSANLHCKTFWICLSAPRMALCMRA